MESPPRLGVQDGGFVWKVVSVLFSFAWKVAVVSLSLALSFVLFFVTVAADLSWGSLVYDTTGIPPVREDDW